jgi:peptide/nickel transport system substrate-binding protein
VPTLGTSFITFNLEKGPFVDKRVRQAAAHAIDHEAIRQAVFYGRGETARSYYAPASPWHSAGVKPWPEYDPEKAKSLLRAAKAVGAEIALQAEDVWPYMQQTAELVQAMWTEVGFKVTTSIYDRTVLLQKRRNGEFHADSMAASYRWDPDGFYARQLLSSGATTKIESRFNNEKADKLILEAKRTPDRQKRLELYAAVDSVINEEVPILYLHHLTLLEAGSMKLKGYKPAVSGAFSIKGGGIRTAWIEA